MDVRKRDAIIARGVRGEPRGIAFVLVGPWTPMIGIHTVSAPR